MPITTEPTLAAEPNRTPVQPIIVRLKEELAKPGLVVAATEVSKGNYRVNWFRYEGYAARVVASKFLKVEDSNGTLVITEQSQ